MCITTKKMREMGKYTFDEALDCTGFGKYNVCMLVSCCLLILAMYMDIFGFSVMLPAVACDLGLSTSQQGLLSAVPLIGVMFSSYAWGLCADTSGRRSTLIIAMPVGIFFSFAASLAPTYASLAALKFISAAFTSSANAAAFVLVGECAPKRLRSRFISLMASATLFVQFLISLFAIPIFKLTFRIPIAWLTLDYRPWRLLMLIISLPGVIGILTMVFLHESPKHLLSKRRDDKALEVLRCIYKLNGNKDPFPVTSVYLDEHLSPTNAEASFIRKIWNQTAPLFKPPLLINSLKLYYILLCSFMTSTGYTMWVPTMTNAYFDGDDRSGQTFCEVASSAAASKNSTSSDCDNAIQPLTLYAVMFYSGIAGSTTVLLSFIVDPVGKKRTTLFVFTISAVCGVVLLFVKIPLLSIAMFYMFLYVQCILGNINTYLVELNPTYLRGMATCLSVVVARGFGFCSVQLIGVLLADHCTPMVTGYVVLIITGLIVAFFLPSDINKKENEDVPVAFSAHKTRF